MKKFFDYFRTETTHYLAMTLDTGLLHTIIFFKEGPLLRKVRVESIDEYPQALEGISYKKLRRDWIFRKKLPDGSVNVLLEKLSS